MASNGKTKKRSKAFYKKSAYGGKKYSDDKTHNVLLPGIRGFLVTCNFDERSAVRECYNILNEYADILYGPDKNAGLCQPQHILSTEDGQDDECDDVEKALKKEVEELKRASGAPEKRFQNVATKAKNCVFIRTSLENPIEVTCSIMEDIAEKHLKKARYAARILPIIGTCRANTKEIEKLASDVLTSIFTKENEKCPKSYTILFKMRNNNGTSCGRDSVIPAIKNVLKTINPDVQFSWMDYSTAVVVEVVCTVCCLGVAPNYFRFRKYNLQELTQGPKTYTPDSSSVNIILNNEVTQQDDSVNIVETLKEHNAEINCANKAVENDKALEIGAGVEDEEKGCKGMDCDAVETSDNGVSNDKELLTVEQESVGQ